MFLPTFVSFNVLLKIPNFYFCSERDCGMSLLLFCLGAQWSLRLWVRAVCQSLISGSANSGDLRFNPLARWATGSITTLCLECLFIFHNEPKHSPSAFIDISVPKSISAASLPHKHSSGLVGRRKKKNTRERRQSPLKVMAFEEAQRFLSILKQWLYSANNAA